MVTGGSVQSTIALGGLVALVVSWWWEPPRINLDRWAWVWTVASIFALVYSVLTAIVTGDFLGVGGQFLVWLIVAKAFNRRAARDWQQMYLLSFLMLVAGSVLNPDLDVRRLLPRLRDLVDLGADAVPSPPRDGGNLLVKHAVDRASERVEVRRILDSKRIVGGRFFVGTGLLSLAVFGSSAVLFLAMPRIGMGFFLKARGGLTFAGFNEGTKLGGHGVIKNDSTVVMRVEIDPIYGGRDAPEIHWRGASFDHYERGQWSRSQSAAGLSVDRGQVVNTATHETVDERHQGYERHYLLWEAGPVPAEEIDAVQERGVRQEVWLESFDTSVLFGASRPRVFEIPKPLRPRRQGFQQNEEVRFEHSATIHYTVWSQLAPPPPNTLRATSDRIPAELAPFIQVPAEIKKPLRDLAVKITTGLRNNYDRAVAIQNWLDANLTYTLELADPGDEDPVLFFLFHRKKGHCEYFASAFALLARSIDIPVRTVNGFLGGEWNEYKGYVAIRAGDAHSWDEVYFPGAGWIMFDPTPANDELGRGGSGWGARLGRILDTLRFQWSKWVIEYDLASQLALFKDIGHALKSGATWLRDEGLALLHHWKIVIAIGCAISLLVLSRRRRRDLGPSAVARERARTRSKIAIAYDQAAKLLAKAGQRRDTGTTPRELAARLASRGHPAAAQVRELVDLYYAAEWGRRSDPAAEARATALVTDIRVTLRESERAAKRAS